MEGMLQNSLHQELQQKTMLHNMFYRCYTAVVDQALLIVFNNHYSINCVQQLCLMQMAEAQVNTVATEHGVASRTTQPVTEHAAAAADHTDGITTVTEQGEPMLLWSTNDTGVSATPVTHVDLPPNAATMLERLRQEIHVEFNNDMWWVMPDELSGGILNEWKNGALQVSFVWDWGDSRTGSYECNGEETSLSRYIIDFQTMMQRNTDNNRTRRVKVVCILC